MTRLVTITKTGPAFGPPASLVDLLERSVAYASEARRQTRTQEQREAGPLPTDAQLEVTHGWLNAVCNGLPVMPREWFPRG